MRADNVRSPPADLVGGRVVGRRVDETTDGVTTLWVERSTENRRETSSKTYAVLRARVELASVVAVLDVELGLVDETSDHPVVLRLEELGAEEGALLHDAGAVALLGAPRDLVTLGVGDGRVGGSRGPKAEVYRGQL
jgi:hypothetical protein